MRHTTKPAELTLINGTDTVVIRPRVATSADPVFCRQWDLGAPDVRVTATPIPGSDGTEEGPAFLGARTITLDLTIQGSAIRSAYDYLTTLTKMSHPLQKPVLKVSRATGTAETWTLPLRGNPFSVQWTRRSAALIDVQLSFTSPGGLLEGPLRSYEFQAAGTESGGLVFPSDFPEDFGTGASTNPYRAIDVGGMAPVSPTLYFQGPLTGAEAYTDDNERFRMPDLILAAGQLAMVDMETGDVLLDGNPANSLYHLVDFDVSSFWRWNPGRHIVRHVGNSGRLTVQFTERALTI